MYKFGLQIVEKYCTVIVRKCSFQGKKYLFSNEWEVIPMGFKKNWEPSCIFERSLL